MNREADEANVGSAEEDRRQKLREEFARIAALPSEETDVEFAFVAQLEAIPEGD